MASADSFPYHVATEIRQRVVRRRGWPWQLSRKIAAETNKIWSCVAGARALLINVAGCDCKFLRTKQHFASRYSLTCALSYTMTAETVEKAPLYLFTSISPVITPYSAGRCITVGSNFVKRKYSGHILKVLA